MLKHLKILRFSERKHKATSSRKGGFLLIESTVSLSILTILSLALLKLSINVLHPRQWTMIQTLSDSYMDRERAWAQRIPFGYILLPAAAPGTQPVWPLLPATSVVNPVVLGNLPNQLNGAAGNQISGIVVRTCEEITPVAGNVTGMSVFRLQSVLTYNVPGKGTYIKSRTVIRSQ
jgi:hypothetical protein